MTYFWIIMAFVLFFLAVDRFTNNKNCSSTLFALGAVLFLIFFIVLCQHVLEGFGHSQ
ncbi:MAG: hypothetical protein JWO95_2848 [Verrucomicrobiales bacterium]|nr:hypothetical protein [Verrucomicrobiales bacterium]